MYKHENDISDRTADPLYVTFVLVCAVPFLLLAEILDRFVRE